jgi:hypothetical protein
MNKAFCFSISFFILLFCFGCMTGRRTHCYNEKYYTALRMTISEVPKRVEEIRQELMKSGIDTVFIYGKECRDCYSVPIIGKEKDEKKGYRHSFLAYATPSYIFWTSKGQYFVKKIDQFTEYETIQRPDFLEFPLYDYFMQNNAAIQKENYFYGSEGHVYQNGAYVRNNIAAGYYEMEPVFMLNKGITSNTTTIRFKAGELFFEKTLQDEYFIPVATEKFEKEERIKYKSSIYKERFDSVIIGNDKISYIRNREMKIYLWTKQVESELFDIETHGLWVPVDDKKKKKG